jgi:hypothetical protein
MRKTLVITLLCTLIVKYSQAQGSQRIIYYLHGRIVEVQGANAVETTNGYGPYRYNDILDSLRSHGFEVRSEVRGPETEVVSYAEKLKLEIEDLIRKGVPASHITVIGASKGSAIAMHLSSILKNEDVNFVFMASCSEDQGLPVFGNILSIHEKSDFYHSCQHLKDISKGIRHYKDIEINTGLRHGFLYRPIPQWLQPALKWASGRYD